jgi:hypothetical protein
LCRLAACIFQIAAPVAATLGRAGEAQTRGERGRLPPRAREAAPDYDIHHLYQEWVSWWRDSRFAGIDQTRTQRFPASAVSGYERAPLR